MQNIFEGSSLFLFSTGESVLGPDPEVMEHVKGGCSFSTENLQLLFGANIQCLMIQLTNDECVNWLFFQYKVQNSVVSKLVLFIPP